VSWRRVCRPLPPAKNWASHNPPSQKTPVMYPCLARLTHVRFHNSQIVPKQSCRSQEELFAASSCISCKEATRGLAATEHYHSQDKVEKGALTDGACGDDHTYRFNTRDLPRPPVLFRSTTTPSKDSVFVGCQFSSHLLWEKFFDLCQ
jgi:hypothetical protein